MSGNAGDASRQDNGLTAGAFVPLTDVRPEVSRHLLDALGRARIAAYLTAPPEPAASDPRPAGTGLLRLYVAADERIDARTVVAAALRAFDDGTVLPPPPDSDDPDATRRAFEALVGGWRVDTVAAVREAERDLAREDPDWRLRLNAPQASDEVWLDDDHYVPPAPPPLPRLAAPTIIAMTAIAIAIVLLGTGGLFGLASTFTLLLGVCCMVLGIGLLFSRLREHRHDDEDDGTAI